MKALFEGIPLLLEGLFKGIPIVNSGEGLFQSNPVVFGSLVFVMSEELRQHELI